MDKDERAQTIERGEIERWPRTVMTNARSWSVAFSIACGNCWLAKLPQWPERL